MRNRIDCCKDCVDDRHPGCGATCEEYKRQRAELDESNAINRRKREAQLYLSNSVVNGKDARSKNKKKNRGYGNHGHTD